MVHYIKGFEDRHADAKLKLATYEEARKTMDPVAFLTHIAETGSVYDGVDISLPYQTMTADSIRDAWRLISQRLTTMYKTTEEYYANPKP